MAAAPYDAVATPSQYGVDEDVRTRAGCRTLIGELVVFLVGVAHPPQLPRWDVKRIAGLRLDEAGLLERLYVADEPPEETVAPATSKSMRGRRKHRHGRRCFYASVTASKVATSQS